MANASTTRAQDRDADLQMLKAEHPLQYVDRLLAPDIHVCCYTAQPDDPWRIYLLDELLENAVRWYHLALSHIGSNRLHDTSMSMHLYNKKLKSTRLLKLLFELASSPSAGTPYLVQTR